MADTIIQHNKTKLLSQKTTTADGETRIVFASEADAVRLFGYVDQLVNGSFYWEVWERGGSIANHKRLLYRSPTYKSPVEPSTFTIAAGQLLEVVLYHSGTVSWSIFGTGVSGAVAAYEHHQLIHEDDEDTSELFQVRMLMHLHNIEDLLERMLNHLRITTDINTSDGEKF